MKRLIVVLMLAAASLITGMATGFDLMLRLFYLILFILGGSYLWMWLSLRRLEVTATRPDARAEVGDAIEERIMVQSSSPLSKSFIEIVDQSDMPGHHTGKAISLGPRGYHSWKVTTRCKRRGLFTIGPLVAVGKDPFGIFKQKKTYAGYQNIIVYPKTYDIPKFGIPAAELSGDVALRQRVNYVTPHASSVREYTTSDSMGRIHWPSSARLNKLMVKEFDHGQSSNVWIFLDLFKYVQAGDGENSTDEYAVAIAASVAKRYLERNYPVGMVAYGDKKYELGAETGRGQLDRIMDFLALSKADGEIPLEEALPMEEGLFSRYGSLVVITPSWHEEWVNALGVLLKRQIRVATILIDPASFGSRRTNTPVLDLLAANGVPSFMVRRGDDIPNALSSPYKPKEMPEPIREAVGGRL